MRLCKCCHRKAPVYWTQQISKTREAFGGMCSKEGCSSTTELEFAHRHGYPTKLKGMGRGSTARFYDIVNNPVNYQLLCKKHHREYDKKPKSVQHLKNIKVRDEYGTPIQLFKDACEELKIKPAIDIAASKVHHVLSNYITEKENCFSQNIDVDFFMNPPYSKVYAFMEFAYNQHKKNNVSALILVYNKSDTKWYHEFVKDKAEVIPIKGRIRFLKDGIQTKDSAPYPSAWIVFRRTEK